MVSILNISPSGFKQQNSYGNIQKIGTQEGRAVYSVVDSDGSEAGKLSVPEKESDTFEAAYKDVMDAAPKIQKYVLENSSDEDIKKRRNKSRLIVGTGGLIGAAVPIALIKNLSTTKRVLSTVAGIIVGISAGFAASLAATTPPGTYKFAKATRTFAKLDIQPVEDNKSTDLQA